jgi:hypothetical protein
MNLIPWEIINESGHWVEVDWPADGKYEISRQWPHPIARPGSPSYMALFERKKPVPEGELRDVERYRWLRSHSWIDVSIIKSVLNFGPGFHQTKPEVLDAAIDEAMQFAAGSKDEK